MTTKGKNLKSFLLHTLANEAAVGFVTHVEVVFMISLYLFITYFIPALSTSSTLKAGKQERGRKGSQKERKKGKEKEEERGERRREREKKRREGEI